MFPITDHVFCSILLHPIHMYRYYWNFIIDLFNGGSRIINGVSTVNEAARECFLVIITSN